LFSRQGALFSALIIALSPVFIYYSHTENVDIPSLFWCAFVLFIFARLVRGEMQRLNYVLLGLAAGMGMATKEQVFGLLVLLPVPILLLTSARDPNGWDWRQPFRFGALMRALVDPNILLGLATCIATFALATHMVFNWDANWWRLSWRINNSHPKMQELYINSPVEVSGVLDSWRQTLELLWNSMNPYLFICSIAGVLYFTFRERWAAYFSVPLLSYFCTAIPMMSFLRVRFVMELVLVLAFFGGRFLSTVWSWGSRRGFVVPFAVTALWAYALLYGFSVNYLMMYDARYAAEAWMQANLKTGVQVETYSQATYLPRFPRHVEVTRTKFKSQVLASLSKRKPDYLVLTSAEHDKAEEKTLLDRLVRGEFGYRLVRSFETEPLVGQKLIRGLSPRILVLTKNGTDAAPLLSELGH
jgi:4-amino-4-deoxy-L-arabinose transferase-like glycosyltransferase